MRRVGLRTGRRRPLGSHARRDRRSRGGATRHAAGSRADGVATDYGPLRFPGSGGRRFPSAGGRARWGAKRCRGVACATRFRRASSARGRPRAQAVRAAGTVRASVASMLGRRPDGEALASLLAATGEHRAAPLGLHARTEAVFVDAATVARAIRRPTHSRSSNVRAGNLYTGGWGFKVDFSTHDP